MTNSAASGDAIVDIDARGMKCPWPALRLARMMRTAQSAVIVADDPVAPAEISSLAGERGWTVKEIPTALGAGWHISR